MADFQQVKRMLEGLMTDEAILEDGHELSTSQIYEYLSNVMYARRSKFDPYWNALLVAGLDKGEPCVHLSLFPLSPCLPSLLPIPPSSASSFPSHSLFLDLLTLSSSRFTRLAPPRAPSH